MHAVERKICIDLCAFSTRQGFLSKCSFNRAKFFLWRDLFWTRFSFHRKNWQHSSFFLCVFLEYYIFPLLCYIILQLVLCIFTALRDLTIDFMTYFNIVSNNFSIPKVILNALACWLCWGGGGANRFLFLKGAFQQMIVFMVHCWTFLVKLVCLPVEI